MRRPGQRPRLPGPGISAGYPATTRSNAVPQYLLHYCKGRCGEFPAVAGAEGLLRLADGGRPGRLADVIVHRRYPAIHTLPGQSYPQSVDGYVE